MRRRSRSLFGSARGGFFKEPSRSRPTRERSQRVRFRRRYASSVARRTATVMWTLGRLGIVAAVVGWAGMVSLGWWRTTPLFKVQAVDIDASLPDGLPGFLAIKPGENLFSLDLGARRTAALTRFRELEDVKIRRTLKRGIYVSGRYRSAMAVVDKNGHPWGVDAHARVFPSGEKNPLPPELPVLLPYRDDHLPMLVRRLQEWKKKTPEFYRLVKFLETDRIRSLNVELHDGVIVRWGTVDDETSVARAENVERLLAAYAPAKRPATLRFVSADRIVMDANWQKLDSE